MEKIKNRWLIATSAMGIHMSIGAIYVYSVFRGPLLEKVGWALQETSWAFSLAIVCLGLSAAFLGRKVESMGPRKSGMLSAVFYSLGLIISGFGVYFESLYLFYFGYGVIGGIGLGIGYICPVATLLKWFPDRRGLASGLAIMGFGFGALLASSLIQYLMELFGIANTFFTLGVVYFITMCSSAQYLAPPPEGWIPKGFEDTGDGNDKKIKEDLAQLTSIEALKTVRFYYLWIMFFVNITCGITLISVASPLAQELAGLTPVVAAAMVGTMGLFNGFGRLGWSSFSDIIGRPITFSIFFSAQVFAFFLLTQTSDALFFQALIFFIVTCYGGGFATMPAFIGDVFGTKNLSAILGNILTAKASAGLVGPQLVSYIYQSTGSYHGALYVFAGLLAVAFVVSILMQFNIKQIRDKKAEMQLNQNVSVTA